MLKLIRRIRCWRRQEEAAAELVEEIEFHRELETARAVLEAGADILVHSVTDRRVDGEFTDLVRRRAADRTTSEHWSKGKSPTCSSSADPLADIRNLRRISSVMKGGEFVH